eukprot:2645556-Prymnesium_polylepis.2
MKPQISPVSGRIGNLKRSSGFSDRGRGSKGPTIGLTEPPTGRARPISSELGRSRSDLGPISRRPRTDLGSTSSARLRPDPTRPRPRPDRRRPRPDRRRSMLTYGERPTPVAYVGVLSRATESCPDSRDRCGRRTARRAGRKGAIWPPTAPQRSIEGGLVTADE